MAKIQLTQEQLNKLVTECAKRIIKEQYDAENRSVEEAVEYMANRVSDFQNAFARALMEIKNAASEDEQKLQSILNIQAKLSGVEFEGENLVGYIQINPEELIDILFRIPEVASWLTEDEDSDFESLEEAKQYFLSRPNNILDVEPVSEQLAELEGTVSYYDRYGQNSNVIVYTLETPLNWDSFEETLHSLDF